MRAIMQFFISMLSQGGISSKRVWGSVILTMLCFCYVWCTLKNQVMLDCTGEFLALAGMLLGLETIVKPFSNKNGNNGDSTSDDNA